MSKPNKCSLIKLSQEGGYQLDSQFIHELVRMKEEVFATYDQLAYFRNHEQI